MGVFQTLVFKLAVLSWGNEAQLWAGVCPPAANSSAEIKYLIRPTPRRHREPGVTMSLQYSFQGSLESPDRKSGKTKAGQKEPK